MVLFHISMRVRLTTQILPPWAVQDTTGTIMEIDFSPRDKRRVSQSGNAFSATEMCLEELPLGVYIKLDDCTHDFFAEQSFNIFC